MQPKPLLPNGASSAQEWPTHGAFWMRCGGSAMDGSVSVSRTPLPSGSSSHSRFLALMSCGMPGAVDGATSGECGQQLWGVAPAAAPTAAKRSRHVNFPDRVAAHLHLQALAAAGNGVDLAQLPQQRDQLACSMAFGSVRDGITA